MIKKDSTELNLRPQGSLFLMWCKNVLPESNLQPLDFLVRRIQCSIRWRLRHYCANIRYLRYSNANSRSLYHSCSIGLTLRSYTHKCRRWILLTSINIFLIIIYNKECPIYLSQGRLYVQSKQIYAQIKQLYDQFKQSLPSSWFGSDKIIRLPCNQF